MGMSTITAARIYKGQLSGNNGEEYQLVYEKFPNIGLSKTYNVDKQVPDSAGTATAMFTGVKSNYYMLGLDSNAQYGVCDNQRNKRSRLDSIMKWAQVAGKDTGVVTTTRVTHATPAALYAHSNHRDWECDSEIPLKYRDCIKDIARQLVEDEPAKNFKVILGGGQKQLGIPVEPNDDDSCNRTDGRNLLHTWMEGRQNSLFVNNTGDLMNANVDKLDYLMGIFSPGHMPYALERDHGPNGSPSLQNMTAQAIKMLSKSSTGFVLMVEGGRIDHAHHANYAKMALHEASELADAVDYAVANTNPRETLIIVTADHSHAFTMNGYPNRGNDILGYANKSVVDNPYETLTYANGPGYYTHLVSNSSDCSSNLWRVIPEEERKQSRYRHFSPYYLEDETHGGEDVPVFSTGPSSYLLTGVFEQNYIAHVMGYAACMGPPGKYCEDVNIGMLVSPSASSSHSVTAMSALFIPALTLSIGALYKR
ncbi:alkaline phosphatase 4-like isoform X2 [Periplaneta americana]